jgi:hypothetical protein
MLQLNVSDSELSLILEVFEHQKSQLLVELRHADSRKFRTELHERLELIESLIARAASVRSRAGKATAA